MSTLVTIDGIGFTVSDTWNPPPHIEYGRSYGNVPPIVGAVVAVDLVTEAITAADGSSGQAVFLDQAASAGDIDTMSTNGSGTGYNVRIDTIRIVTNYQGSGVDAKFAYGSDLTVINTGQNYAVGDSISFAGGTSYGTVTAVTS